MIRASFEMKFGLLRDKLKLNKFSWTLWPGELGPWPEQTADTPDIEEQVQFQFQNPMGPFKLALNIPKPIFKCKIQTLELFYEGHFLFVE